MSDTDSADTALRRNARRIRRSHQESPLRPTGDPTIDSQSILQLAENLAILSHSLDSRLECEPPAGAITTPPTSGDNTAAVPVPEQRGPRKPVTTLVSMLPKTIYNEADEAVGTVRTPPYVRVQHQLLHYLGSHASDTLTPRQAHRWTEDIADNEQPQAKDTLRLCYYMRSQGFDTYADFRDSLMSLYIANQKADTRGPRTDLLYWKQNFKNNAIAIEGTAPSGSTAARGLRRNAFAPADVTTQELLAHLSAIGTANQRAQHGHGEEAGSYVGPVSEDVQEQEDGQEQDGRIAGATADLETLLLANSPDTEAVDAAIARIEQYRAQGHGN